MYKLNLYYPVRNILKRLHMKSSTLSCLGLSCSIDYSKAHNVFIVEDSKIIRAGLRQHINNKKAFCIVRESSYSSDIVQEAYDSKTNVILFSSFTKNKDNLEIVKEVKKNIPLVKSIILAQEADEEEFCQTIMAGAKGYCSQNCNPDELMRAINIVSSGGCYFDSDMGNFIFRIINHMGQMKQLPIDKPVEEQFGLTDRELEVIAAAAVCENYVHMGKALNISPHTVKMHLSNTYKKLGVKNKLEAILKLHNKIYEFKF